MLRGDRGARMYTMVDNEVHIGVWVLGCILTSSGSRGGWQQRDGTAGRIVVIENVWIIPFRKTQSSLASERKPRYVIT